MFGENGIAAAAPRREGTASSVRGGVFPFQIRVVSEFWAGPKWPALCPPPEIDMIQYDPFLWGWRDKTMRFFVTPPPPKLKHAEEEDLGHSIVVLIEC